MLLGKGHAVLLQLRIHFFVSCFSCFLFHRSQLLAEVSRAVGPKKRKEKGHRALAEEEDCHAVCVCACPWGLWPEEEEERERGQTPLFNGKRTAQLLQQQQQQQNELKVRPQQQQQQQKPQSPAKKVIVAFVLAVGLRSSSCTDCHHRCQSECTFQAAAALTGHFYCSSRHHHNSHYRSQQPPLFQITTNLFGLIKCCLFLRFPPARHQRVQQLRF